MVLRSQAVLSLTVPYWGCLHGEKINSISEDLVSVVPNLDGVALLAIDPPKVTYIPFKKRPQADMEKDKFLHKKCFEPK